MIKKILLGCLVFCGLNTAQATQSMRRCLLLPIIDEVKDAVSFPVYEEVEYYLKNSDWCYYRSNSGIIDILGNYKNNLKQHLQNKEVLKILSEKTNSGSMLRIFIENEIEGIRVELDVIGENGEDVYFSEETILEDNADVGRISRTLKNWLNEYEQVIPYDGKVTGVLGDQFTTDIGREYGILPKDLVKIIRPIEKQRHPLLKEVVEWKTQDVASGEIFHAAEVQSQGRAFDYSGEKRLQPDDWIIVQERKKEVEQDDQYEDSDYRFGKLGRLGLGLVLGSGSSTLSAGNIETKKIGGLLAGAEIDLELWMTRNYWIGLEFSQTLSSFSQKEGAIEQSSNSASFNNYKIKLGYKYLPLGFFYGPQLDFYTGYARYGYGLDTSRNDGFTEVSFKGLHFGSRGSIPIMKKLRAYLEIEFIFNPNFNEVVSLQGKEDSTSNFNIGFGAAYDYNPKMSFYGAFNFSQSRATYEQSNQELKHKSSTISAGTQFTF